MRSAELVIDYSNLDKPIQLIERQHGLGGTDYYTICSLTEDHAKLLHDEGIGWLYGNPDWQEHYRKLKIYKLEAEKKRIEQELKDLKS